jgi:hypothetical protein
VRNVTRVKTYDGVEHEDQRAALRHLDKLYGETLSHIGHKLAKTDGKYTKMLEVLDASLAEFETLLIIKRDMTMENPEDE